MSNIDTHNKVPSNTNENSDIQSAKPYWTGYRKFVWQSRILLVMTAVGFSAIIAFGIPKFMQNEYGKKSDLSGGFIQISDTDLPSFKILSDYTYYMNNPEFFIYDDNGIVKSLNILGIHVKVNHPIEFVCHIGSNIDSVNTITKNVENVMNLKKDYSYYIDDAIINLVYNKGSIEPLKIEGMYVRIGHPVRILCKLDQN